MQILEKTDTRNEHKYFDSIIYTPQQYDCLLYPAQCNDAINQYNCSLHNSFIGQLIVNKQLIVQPQLIAFKCFLGLEILQFVSRNLDFLHLTIKAGMHAGPAGNSTSQD